MNDKDVPILGNNIDKSQVPSIQQKRMVAFVNHFIVNTVTFLNKFIANCETKFIAFESKLQKVEASLLIVEAKLASIPDVNDPSKSITKPPSDTPTSSRDINESIGGVDKASVPNDDVANTTKEVAIGSSSSTVEVAPSIVPDETVAVEITTSSETITGIKACEDARYRKYFKMNQFGVPLPAVKLKMEADGFDSTILDDPNRILADGVATAPPEEG